MTPVSFTGQTAVAGEAQRFAPLPLMRAEMECPVAGRLVPVIITMWKPDADELALLNAGGCVRLIVQGNVPAPTIVDAAAHV